MSKISFLIDGFNLYHSIRDAEKLSKIPSGLKWLNIPAICASFIPSIRTQIPTIKDWLEIDHIYYFSAYADHLLNKDQGIVNRHKKLIDALESEGVIIRMGKFKKKYIDCKVCHKKFEAHEEKETDVSIAVELMRLTYKNNVDVIALMTGDTDLIPALKVAKAENSNIKLAVIFPFNRVNDELRKITDASCKISQDSYSKFQYPNPFISPKDSSRIDKPSSW